MSSPEQLRRGENELHEIIRCGSIEQTIALLSKGSINIDEVDSAGTTPLMFAAMRGHSHIARILLSRGADLSIAAEGGHTALHISVQEGHLAVTTDLVKAGADLEARIFTGATPLHLAAQEGNSEVMAALIEAGAIVDSRRGNAGSTPLSLAAGRGRLNAVKELLRAGANPLLDATSSGVTFLPLEIAARHGHSEVVRELIQQVGIEGCAGVSSGVDALEAATAQRHVGVMEMLTDAGVVDTGRALILAAGMGGEAEVKVLLQQRQLEGSPTSLDGYINSHDRSGCTALFRSIKGSEKTALKQLMSPRVVRLLVDAGADTTSAVRVTGGPLLCFCGTPLAYINNCLREKKANGLDLTEQQLHRLAAARRLLLRVEAVRAASWLWHVDAPTTQRARHVTSRAKTASTPLGMMLPILRRRAKRRGLVTAPLFRHSVKIGQDPDGEDGDDSAAV